MSRQQAKARSEAEIIEQIAQIVQRCTGHPLDASDDCAHLRGLTDIVTTDTLVEGRHFDLSHDSWVEIGAQAAVVNLSDLAASGARAGWLLWSLVVPEGCTLAQIAALTEGFATVAGAHGARVVGGNLTRAPGNLIITVTAGGPLSAKAPMLRSGAKAGERLWISGPLGDAALGYLQPTARHRRARHRWRAHLPESARLARWGGVGAAMDISDGLLIDAARMAKASDLAIHIGAASVPLGPACARAGVGSEVALRGGEDYVLLFTATERPPIPAWCVGYCAPGEGIWLDGQRPQRLGFDHFDP